MTDRDRFALTGYPFSKSAQGKTFFDKPPGVVRLRRVFRQLVEDPGVAVLTGDAGVGKTASMRNLCADLPKPDHVVVYVSDTAVSPGDVYRSLAIELGVKPSHRRAQLWADIKRALVHMVDERGTAPVVVIDESHHLSDAFLLDLGGFLNFAFDSRDILTLWLVGLPTLSRRLAMQSHAALRTRIVAEVRRASRQGDLRGGHRALPEGSGSHAEAPLRSGRRASLPREPRHLPCGREDPSYGAADRQRQGPGISRRTHP